jgi:RimJ/RimL family protein N-acetyltransferase
MKIEIGKYLIRTWEFSDSTALAKYANNPKIAANLRDLFPHPYTQADAESYLDNVVGKTPPTAFAIANKTEAIGGISLNIGQDVHCFTAELGYWLAEPFWGQGIATLAVIVITDYGFNKLGLNRVYAEPYVTNGASIRVLEKAGFEYEGRLRANVIKHKKVLDQLMYAKVRDGIT